MAESQPNVTRTDILIRLLYTVVFLIALEVVKLLVQVMVVFQYLYLLVAKRKSEHLRTFSNHLSLYGYKILRYITLTDNQRPFPFDPWPENSEALAEKVEYRQQPK
jgi:hypothetical protein